MLDRFTVNVSEDMAAATVNDPSNIAVVAAGPDGAFGTADDVPYHVVSYGYTAGLSVSYRVSDGPLQPGLYRVTIGTGLTDRAGNALAAPYVRNFSVAGVAPFVLENRGNDTTSQATPLGPVTAAFAGSFTNTGVVLPSGNTPYRVVSADLNADGMPRPGHRQLRRQYRQRLPRQRRRHLPAQGRLRHRSPTPPPWWSPTSTTTASSTSPWPTTAPPS